MKTSRVCEAVSGEARQLAQPSEQTALDKATSDGKNWLPLGTCTRQMGFV